MKISKPQIEFLAQEAGITIEQATRIIKKQISERFGIEDSEEFWGFTIAELLDKNVRMIDVEDAVAELGYIELKSQHVEAFTAARIMGDGDCPHCGGKLEWDCLTAKPSNTREIGAPWLEHSEWDYCPICGYDSRNQ